MFDESAELRAPGSAQPASACAPSKGATSPFSLHCIAPSDLAAVAIAGHRDRRVAMLRPSGKPDAIGQVVRRGDAVGASSSRVTDVGPEFVDLEGGVRLALPARK